MLITGKNVEGYQLPDFIIPGAAKSGTTTLYKLLSQHPEIYFPSGKKEPFYFGFGDSPPPYSDNDFVSNIIWQRDDYLHLYRDAPAGSLLGDASTSYLYFGQRAIDHMKLLYGNELRRVKVFIILRDPVGRAYSHYTYLVRNGFEQLPFEKAISATRIEARKYIRWGFDYLNYSLYYESVKAYMNAFDVCKVFLTEDLRNPQMAVNEVFHALGLDPVKVLRDLKANPSGVPKHSGAVNFLRKNKLLKAVGNMLPQSYKMRLQRSRDKVMEKFMVKEPLAPETAQALCNHFASDIEKLSELIQRDLSHWTRQYQTK